MDETDEPAVTGIELTTPAAPLLPGADVEQPAPDPVAGAGHPRPGHFGQR